MSAGIAVRYRLPDDHLITGGGTGWVPYQWAPRSVRPAAPAAGLRRTALTSARWLFARQAAGLVVAGLGLLLVTRQLGPAVYGTYTAAFSYWFFLQGMTEFNIDVWLVRRRASDERAAYETAQTLLLGGGVLGVVVGELTAGPAADLLHIPAAAGCLRLMAPSILVVNASQVALSRLERALDFKRVGLVETAGQCVFSVVSVALAYAGAGLNALVWALTAQQVLMAAGFWLSAPRVRPGWDRPLAGAALRFGAGATASSFAGSGRGLAVPFLVARLAGPAGAGFYTLAERLLDQAGFMRQVVVRMSYALFGRVRDEPARLVAAFSDGLVAQVLLAGIPALAFAWVAPVLTPWVFGARWTRVAGLYPLLLVPYLIFVVIQLYQSLLLSQDRVGAVVRGSALYSSLLTAAAVPALAWLGLSGAALAEGVACLAVVMFHRFVRASLPAFAVHRPLVIVASIGVAAQTATWGPWPAAAILVPLALPDVRSAAAAVVRRRLPAPGRHRSPPTLRLRPALGSRLARF